MNNNQLQQQLDFIVEIDKLKHIYRAHCLANGIQSESDTEHSWHISIMAILLCEHATEAHLDMFRVVKMLLIYDIIHIDTHSLPCCDEPDIQAVKAREQQAAEHLFGIVQNGQVREFRALWQEFEAQETPEARFAASIDRLYPLLYNYKTSGYSWKRHRVICNGKVMLHTQPTQKMPPALWKLVEELMYNSVHKGYLYLN